MPTVFIQSDFKDGMEITTSNTKYIIQEGVTGKTGSETSIWEKTGSANNTYVLNGSIEAQSYSFSFQGNSSKLTITETGIIGGGNGVSLGGSENLLVNNGLISCLNVGIYAQNGGHHVINNGMIHGTYGVALREGALFENNGTVSASTSYGVSMTGDGTICELGETSVVTSDTVGVGLITQFDQTSHLTNKGLIAVSTATAITGGLGKDVVINSGEIRGVVRLGVGDDRFDTRNGIFKYTVDGEDGNDTYLISSGKISISEAAARGTDTVKSTVSISLASNLYEPQELENLMLMGKKNLNAIGNELANEITGNAGNNKLAGHGGPDTFVFRHGNGHDTILDFNLMDDVIDLSNYKGINNFADLKAHHVNAVDGDLVIFSGDDEIRIDHIAKSDLNDVTFMF
jgi:hypothetical protein